MARYFFDALDDDDVIMLVREGRESEVATFSYAEAKQLHLSLGEALAMINRRDDE